MFNLVMQKKEGRGIFNILDLKRLSKKSVRQVSAVNFIGVERSMEKHTWSFKYERGKTKNESVQFIIEIRMKTCTLPVLHR